MPTLEERLAYLEGQLRIKESATSPLGIPPHGPNALFNTPGVLPGIISAIPMPISIETALEQMGHVRKTQFLNPLYGYLTGQTASSGTEATSGCDENAPIAGNLKVAYVTLPFGELTMNTKPIQIDRAGQLLNRSEPMDLRLLNNPFDTSNIPVTNGQVNPQDLFRNVLAKQIVETSVDIRRRYAHLIWDGNPANTIANTGGYQEFNGLEKIVNTGYKDVTTGVTVAKLDSLILTALSGVKIQDQAAKVVRMLVETVRFMKKRAEDIQIGQIQWAFTMRYQAFLALTEVWPCAYETYRCHTAAPSGTSVVIDANSINANQTIQQMREGMYLLIDGERIPVLPDNVMDEANVGGGVFQSDIYLLPLKGSAFSDTNGQITFVEYFDYSGPEGMRDIAQMLGGDTTGQFKVSPDGRFAVAFLGNRGFCKQAQLRTRKRLIVRAPFLAARIPNVRYDVYLHEDDWEPGTSFYTNGGNTSFVGQTVISPF